MSDYLQKMGIESWRLQASRRDNMTYYHLGQPPIVTLVSDAEPADVKAQQLLLAIVKAMQQPFDGAYAGKLAIKNLPETVNLLVLLGQRVCNQLLGKPADANKLHDMIFFDQEQRGRQVLVTHSLENIMSSQALKAETWQDLQGIMRILTSIEKII